MKTIARKFTLLLGLTMAFSGMSTTKAQNEGKKQRIAYGHIINQQDKRPIIGAKIYQLRADSTVADSSVTSRDMNVGSDRGIYHFFMTKEGGTFTARIVAEGYEEKVIELNVSPFKGRTLVQKMPNIELRKKREDHQLDAARVRATKIKFYHRGDTVVYNADAFNLSEGSMLDALIKQIPGAELKEDGQILINGERVESLLLNGEDFFKGNNQVMLDNLPAYTVKDLQVYHKRSDLSDFIGQDLGKKDLVINVRLKKEYNESWIANAEVGSGTKDRYLARLFAMRNTDHSNITLFGNMNNLNDSRQPGQEGSWTPEKMPSGLMATKLAGMRYNVNQKDGQYKLDGGVQVKHTDGDNYSSTSGENFLTTGNTFRRGESRNRSRMTDLSLTHSIRLKSKTIAQHNIHTFASYNNWKNGADAVEATFESEPFGYGTALLDSMRRPKAGSLLRSMALNRYLSATQNHGSKYNIELHPEAFLKSVGNDIIILSGQTELQNRQEERFANNLYDYPKTGEATDFRRQWQDMSNRKQHYNGTVGYGFIFPTGLLFIPAVGIDHQRERDKNPLYRLDRLNGWGAEGEQNIGELPSMTDFRLQTVDLQNSTWSHNAKTEKRVNMQVQWNTMKDTKKHWNSISLEIPLHFVHESLNLRRANYDGHTSRHYTTLGASLWMAHFWDDDQNRISLSYESKCKPANMISMIDLPNTSDPLNIYHGNPSLKNAQAHEVTLYYQASRPKLERQWSTYLTYQITKNAQAYSYSYNSQTGIRNYRPDNVNGNYEFTFSGNYSTALDKKKKHWSISNKLVGTFDQSVDLMGMVRSTVHTTWISDDLGLKYRLGKHTIGASGTGSWQQARSSREDFVSQSAWDFHYGLSATVELPLDAQLSTDIMMYSRRGYDNPASNTNDLVWNARLTKRFTKQRLTLMVDGFDILGNLSNITQTMNAQGRFETYRNALPRYVMAHLVYRFDVKPKKERTETKK